MQLAGGVRLCLLAAIAVWFGVAYPPEAGALGFALFEIGIFALIGLGYLLVAWNWGRGWAGGMGAVYGLTAIDCVCMGLMFSILNPFINVSTPPDYIFKYHNFFWFYIFLMQAAFSLRPSLVLWTGFCILAVRASQLFYVLSYPGVLTEFQLTGVSLQEMAEFPTRPNFVEMSPRIGEAIATLGIAIGLAFVVRRARSLVRDAVLAERGRANLARYFSPNVVDELARDSARLNRARTENVAVVFVDIVGFTGMSQSLEPSIVIQRLRTFYDRMGQQVFDHNGTLDKYLGDGLMASFGTPWPTEAPAADALACVIGMAEALEDLNRDRLSSGDDPIWAGIGAHYGPAILGNVGNVRRLEVAVLGDTVNVASRLEEATRAEGVQALLSDDLVQAARAQGGGAADLFGKLEKRGERALRGREGTIAVWAVPWPGSPPPAKPGQVTP